MTDLKKIIAAMEAQSISGYRLSKMTGIHFTDIYRVLSGQRELFPGWKRRIFEALSIEGGVEGDEENDR